MSTGGTSLAGQRAIKIGVQLKFLQSEDKPRVKELCKKFFPIDYPEKWYNDITSDKKYFALSAVFQGMIVGVIVAEVKPRSMINHDDSDILSSNCSPDTKVAYLLSLGVLSEYRENGIGSLLIDSLITELRGKDKSSIKAVYLHVLCTNLRAIMFYEKREFVQHKLISGYYSINNKEEDGYCYVRYINGGQPPWSMSDYMRQVTIMFTKFQSCSTGGSGGGSSGSASNSISGNGHHYSHRNSSTQKAHNTNNQNSHNHSQSVHSYAANVLSKLPKLLPASLPKISSLFPSSPNPAPDLQAGRDDDSEDHRTVSAASSNYSSTNEEPVATLEGCGDTDDKNPVAVSGSFSEGNSSCEEFHDSLSSPSQLESAFEEPTEPNLPIDVFCKTTVILDDDTTRLHESGKSGNRKIPGFTSNGKQNSVASLISSTLPTKLKLKTFYPSGSKLQPINVSKFSSTDKKSNGATGTGNSKKFSRKKPLCFNKSKSSKTLLQDDEEVLNESSESDGGEGLTHCDLPKGQSQCSRVEVTCDKCEDMGTNLLPNTVTFSSGCVKGQSAMGCHNSSNCNNQRLKGGLELRNQWVSNSPTSAKLSSWAGTNTEDDCTVT